MRRLPLHWPAVAPIVAGQAMFVALMAVCVAMRPSRVALERGLSFYGNELDTAVPFALAIVTSGALTCFAVRRIRPAVFRRCTGGIVALTALIPLTPYRVDVVFDYLHIGITSLVFAAAFVFGLWIAWRILRSRAAAVASTAQLVAGCCAFAAQIGLHDLMIPAQVAFELAFATLLAFATSHLAAS